MEAFPTPPQTGKAAAGPEPGGSLVDLVSLVRGAAAAVERLAAQQNVKLDLNVPDAPWMVSSDAVIARQILVSLFSRAVQQANESVAVELRRQAGVCELVFMYHLRAPLAASLAAEALLQNFIQQLGWAILETTGPDGVLQVELRIAGPGTNLLMIDDDDGFIALIRRYLTGLPVNISAVHSGVEGIRRAQQGNIGVILLDVMMPGLDGWEVLQTLRTDPRTMNIPVVVCSVFYDPELARSLGASLMLHKPTSQEDLLAGLEFLGLS
jgi:CheY-like chemotaxis protein